ncbi:hypothetical protein [Bacillus solimangrovi]|uniref:Uncharacterized protein n=1 Tax=Bacillus solimangrovi TaxID=1305675 RepID=A0A1E5LEK3_9BACI|nr:hypothetical protein [Bacillus solimangrovi]OEH92495.1 hypothetical protein BFG57_15675 [Bacillus solimangrovi]
MKSKKITVRKKVTWFINSLIIFLFIVLFLREGLQKNDPVSLFFYFTVGVILISLIFKSLKNKPETKEQRLEKWKLIRKRGVYYYIFTRGLLGYSVPIWLIAWGFDTDFSQGIMLSDLLEISPFIIIFGLFSGWVQWSKREEELIEENYKYKFQK